MLTAEKAGKAIANHIAGRWWGPHQNGSVYSAMSPTLNRIYFCPLWTPGERHPVDAIGFWLNALAPAGAVARFGLYADSNGLPSGSPLWQSVALSTDAGAGSKFDLLPAGTEVGDTPKHAALVFQGAVVSNQAVGYAAITGDSRFCNGNEGPLHRYVRYQDGVSGALPTATPANGTFQAAPFFMLRLA